jgi:acyl transferase domain-containing protein/NAD(P)-dependent dehydrogenase (short-subunit alcohol dehydrogenase family)
LIPKDSTPTAEPLAVIGIGCLFPRAPDFRTFWANIRNGIDAVTDIPPTHWRPEDYLDADPKSPDRVYVARGAFLEPVPFPPTEFGIAPNNLEATDTAQLLGLMVAKAALEDAGYDAGRIDRNRVGCILDVTGTLELVIPLGARLGHPVWRRALAEAGVPKDTADDVVRRISDNYVGWQENSFPGLLGNVVAGRIANRLDLGGTNCVVDAACASSLSAVHLAALELQSGRAELVLTGGVDTFNDIFMYMCFSKTPALSPTGDARPFDRDGDGTILGEGLGMVVLKRLSDARRDADRVYAVLKGVGTSSDGKGNAVYAPRAAGQIEALRSAYRAAGVTPDTIELVEAHGTGTQVGDATEVEALTAVFSEYGISGTPKSAWCALGSVKSQIGHTKAAAGAAGLIKAVAALYHKELPPTIKVRQPLETLRPGKSPFYVNTRKRPWMPSPAHPRRAAVSAFGFGGSNFHCVLEEGDPHKGDVDWDADVQIVAFAQETTEAIEAELAEWRPDLTWPEIASRAAQSREQWRSSAEHRLVIVVQRSDCDLGKLVQRARASLRRSADPDVTPDVFYGCGDPVGRLAVLFPGQGAQYPGMLRDLACAFPAFFDTLVEGDRAFAASPLALPQTARLSDYLYPISAFDGAGRRAQEDGLRDTRVAQPALGTACLGAWRVLESLGVRGEVFAGHSHGELTALCAAGRIKPADFLALSCLRGRLMAEGQGGAMLAVQAPLEAIRAVLHEEQLDLTLANRNAPNQTVLAGAESAIDRAAVVFGGRHMRTTRLAVSAAFHSPAVAAAVKPLRDALEQVPFGTGATVFANSSAAPYPGDPSAARDLLAGQLARPVEFASQVDRMYESGARTFVEVGPGARLTGLVGQILQGRPHAASALDPGSGHNSGFFDLACLLARLAASGHVVELHRWAGTSAVARPANAKTRLVVPICGANYVKRKEVEPSPNTGADRPTTRPHPPTNGATPATMNGQRSEPEGPAPPAAAAPQTPVPAARSAAASDAASLTQALQVTRDSLAALQRTQEHAAQLHRQFLEGQDAAQRTVHLLVEQQQRLLQLALGLPAQASPMAPLPIPPRASSTPVSMAAPQPAPEAPRTEARMAAQPAEAPASTALVVQAVLVAVVSEKTGYPAEMLDPGMALDADLGIDSIKRVEILSALQDRLPHAPPIKAEHLGQLRTLRDISEFLSNGEARPTATGAAPARDASAVSRVAKAEEALLAIVAEKTGYPAEMLEPDMALDADLGIDSIKRVEILSAVQERLPNAPAIKSEHLGALRTLRDVACFLAGTGEQPSLPTAPAESATATLQLERSVLRLSPVAESNPRDRRLLQSGHEIWVSGDDDVLAPLVAAQLRRLGMRATVLSLAAMARGECPDALAGLVLLAPAETTDNHLRDAVQCVRRAGASLQRSAAESGAVLLTVSRLDGGFGLENIDPSREPLDAALAGLAKTAAREWPAVCCRALDVAPDLSPAEAAAAMTDELFQDGPVEVAISRGGRRALALVSRPLQARAGKPLDPGDVVVITGGARGITGEAAAALARVFRPTLVLLGRTPVPGPEPDWLAPLTDGADIKRALLVRANGDATPRLIGERFREVMAQREVRHNIARLAAVGCRVVYRSVDIRDAAAVAGVLSQIRRDLGRVRGLIHGAGLLADALIENKTDDQFDRVYGTKVGGLRSLLSGVNPEDLRVLVLFSSSTARFGRAGQADYAMANEVLNKMARQHARLLPACRVVATNWGPWDGGMVSPELKKRFATEGIGLISLAAGADFLTREIQNADKEAEVIVMAPTVPQTLVSDASGRQTEPSGVRVAPLPVAFERVVDVAEFPVLNSHVLGGRPVVPVALMIEWLAHAALHQNPGLGFCGFDNLRVLHGVILDGAAPVVSVAAGKAYQRESLLFAPVELRSARFGERAMVHARAEVVLGEELCPAPAGLPLPTLGPYSRTVADAYESLLFHGPDLRGIERVDACSPDGIVASVRPAPPPAAWLRQPLRQHWLADPLALDCAFQMMILWSFERHGAGCLPCVVRRYRQFRRSYPAGCLSIAVRVTRDTATRVVTDIDFLDAASRLVARLEGCEAVIDPTLHEVFRRNGRTAAAVS